MTKARLWSRATMMATTETPVTPLHLDLGSPSVVAAPIEGGYAGNFAYVMEMARTGGTPQCRVFYRAGMNEFRRLQDSSLSDGDRKLKALRAAMAAVERKFPRSGGPK